MIKRWAIAIVGVVLVSGCASIENDGALREFDLRKNRYKYIDTDIYMALPAVQRQLYIHKEACDAEVLFRKDPMQVHFATVTYGPAGVSDLKNKVMFDLTAYATGKTAIKGYAYYAANKDLVRQFVRILEKPTICPEGINSKTK